MAGQPVFSQAIFAGVDESYLEFIREGHVDLIAEPMIVEIMMLFEFG